MPAPDPRIDAYLAQAAPFARPILAELRARIHAVCPEAEETLKWKAPAFTYRGKLLAVMAAFKGHVAFNLWHGAQVMETATESAMCQFGRIATLEDLPSRKAFAAPIKAAMALIASGAPRCGKACAQPKAPAIPPEDFRAALAANPAARATFEGFPPGKQRDYVEWILEAKRPDTRQRRIEQAVGWLAEGKSRNWKYETC